MRWASVLSPEASQPTLAEITSLLGDTDQLEAVVDFYRNCFGPWVHGHLPTKPGGVGYNEVSLRRRVTKLPRLLQVSLCLPSSSTTRGGLPPAQAAPVIGNRLATAFSVAVRWRPGRFEVDLPGAELEKCQKEHVIGSFDAASADRALANSQNAVAPERPTEPESARLLLWELASQHGDRLLTLWTDLHRLHSGVYAATSSGGRTHWNARGPEPYEGAS